MMKKAILFSAAVYFSGALLAQSIGTSVELDVRNNDDFTGYEILDSSVMKARVIMTGENHMYVKFNSKIELKMLRYLNKKLGLKNFVIELGGARAHFLNRYIVDENDSMAGKFLRATTSPRYMDLFNRLRKFNSTLPDSLKIHVWGIDVERFNDLPLMRLAELFPADNVPADIRVGVEAVRTAADYLLESGLEDYERARNENSAINSYWDFVYDRAPFYIRPTITEFINYYDSLKPAFEKWLGDKFQEIDQAVGWLKEYKQWNNYDNTTFQYIWREENIYKKLSELVKNNPGERFYGQFGRCHVAYDEQNGDCGWYGYHSVINKMRTRYFHSSDSVLTIGLFYTGYADYNSYSNRSDEGLQDEVNALMDHAKAKTVTLFNLTDGDANMPKLAKKFTFAVVNRGIDDDDQDSVQSEVIDNKDIPVNTESSKICYGLGYTFTTINSDILGQHVAGNGYSTALRPPGTFNIYEGVTGKYLDHSIWWSLMPKIDLHSTDSGKATYGFYQLHYRIAYNLIRKRHVQFNIGGLIGYGREQIKYSQENTSFLATRSDKDFVNLGFFTGPSAQLRVLFGRSFFLSIHAASVFDLSAKQWRYKGSSQEYGESAKVSSGFGGYYFSLGLGFLVDFDEYGNSYYD